MAINEYMGPTQGNFIQDYVSQYIPLPFKEMQNALNVKQKQYDENEGLLGDIRNNLNIKTVPGEDEAYRNEILSGYDSEIDNIIEKSGGDLSLVSNEVRNLANKANKDLTRGPLGILHQRGTQFEKDVNSGNELIKGGKRGAELETDIRSTFLNRYNQQGGVRGQGDYGIYNLTPRVDVQEKLTDFGKEMSPQITEFARILEDEQKGKTIPGYHTKYTQEKKQLAAKHIMDAVQKYAQSDDEIQSWMQTLTDAGRNTEDVIKELSALTGVQLQVNDYRDDLSFTKEYEDAAGRSKKIRDSYMESTAVAEDYSPMKEFDQDDFVDMVNTSNINLARELNDNDLIKNPKLLNELSGDNIYDLIDYKIENGELTGEQKEEFLKKYREIEVIRSQQKYEFNEYNKTPKGEYKLSKIRNTLLESGLSEEEISSVLETSDGVNMLTNWLVLDPYRKIDFENSNLSPTYKQMFNKIPKEDRLRVRNLATIYRNDVNKYASNNSLRTSAYTEKEFGDPNASKELRSNVDISAARVNNYLKRNQLDLTVIPDEGESVTFNSWKDKVIDDAGITDDEKKNIDVTFYPTRSMGKGKYVAKIMAGDRVIAERYVNSNNEPLTNAVYEEFKGSLANTANQKAQQALIEVEALRRFDRLNPKAISNALKGLDSTSGWEVYDPNSKSYTTFTFENERNENNKRTGVIVKNDNGTVLTRGNDITEAIVNLYKKDSNIE